MFIWEDEPEDHRRMQTINGVRFRKYADKIFVHVVDFISPFPDKVELLSTINICIPRTWRRDLSKLWMDIELFEKIKDKLNKKEAKKEIKSKGWSSWVQEKLKTKF